MPTPMDALPPPAAAALRVVGLPWGLPDETHLFSYHPDEFHSLRGALALLLGGRQGLVAGLAAAVMLRRASFKSVKQLREAISAYIAAHNEHAEPCEWTKADVRPKPLKQKYAELRS
jgi:hypothetical protein